MQLAGDSAQVLQRLGPLTAGLGPAMAYNVVLNSTRFSLFDALESDGRVGTATSGLLAGGVAGFLSAPLARWRTLLQAGESAASVRARMTQPFAGSGAWALRNAGHTACIFHLFRTAQDALEQAHPPVPSTLLHLAASLCAASVSCLVMNPLDVYCTRIFHSAQATTTPASLSAPPPAASVGAAVRAGYHGLSANLLRTVPHTVLTFVVIEALRSRPTQERSLSLPALPGSVLSVQRGMRTTES